jgi:hypothetical protein
MAMFQGVRGRFDLGFFVLERDLMRLVDFVMDDFGIFLYFTGQKL